MTGGTLLADEIRVTVSGLFTTHHRLRARTIALGVLTIPVLKAEAVFYAADGRELILDRTSWWRRTYELRANDVLLGTARPLGILRRENDLRFDGRTYRLSAIGVWGRIWRLVGPSGNIVAEIRPRGVFSRGAILCIFESVDLDLLVFAYHLVNACWHDQAAAAGAAAAAGG